MKEAAAGVEVAKSEGFARGGEMAEAVDLLRVGAALGLIDFEVVEIGSAAAGEKEAGGVTFKLEVL